MSADITAVYFTCNEITPFFAHSTMTTLRVSLEGIPLISVSHKPMDFGMNYVLDLPRHHLSIYKQALYGAKRAQTKYIALCEDDVLYSPDHFKHRPSPGKFAYNLAAWNLYTWVPSIFSHKGAGRINLNALICERDLFISAMEERFARYPDGKVNLSYWAEPGKYENRLKVTPQQVEYFYSNPPNVVFSHEEALGFQNLGTRKKLGEFRAVEIPYWGTATNIMGLYREL